MFLLEGPVALSAAAVRPELLDGVEGGGTTDVVERLLLAVARGDREAFAALEGRVGGLVRLNIRRVLRDALRSDTVTEEFFAEVLRDAVDFDPARGSAQAWLLTRAYLRAVDGLSGASGVGDPVDQQAVPGAHPAPFVATG